MAVPTSVGEMFWRAVEEQPNRTFVIFPGTPRKEFTYAEFRDKVIRVQDYLFGMDIIKGDRIAILAHNSEEFVLLYLAALDMGIAVVPINPDLAPPEIQYIIADSGSRIGFFGTDLQSKMYEAVGLGTTSTLPCVRIDLATQHIPRKVSMLRGHSIKEDPAVIIYTSGTTGKPKGVVLTHDNLVSDAQAIADWFSFSGETRTLCILPLYHNNGQIVTLLAPLCAGGSAVITRGTTSLGLLWNLEREYGVTWTSMMPSILAILLSLPAKRIGGSLEGIICGGQSLLPSVQESFESRFGVPVFEGYGLTETTSFACFNDFPASVRRQGSIGRPLPINKMAILDDDGNELGPGKEGEICIRGANVMAGYLGMPIRSRKAFRGGWFHSGDYGHTDSDGYFYFGCRKDDLIIKGGENVYPAELENVLFEHPEVIDCAVIGIPDDLLGENICAFVTLIDGAGSTAADLQEFCSGKIAAFKRAKQILLINELDNLKEIPRGPTKKVLYRELKNYYARRGNNGKMDI